MSTREDAQSAITAALQNAGNLKSLCGKEPFKGFKSLRLETEENTDRWQAIKIKKNY